MDVAVTASVLLAFSAVITSAATESFFHSRLKNLISVSPCFETKKVDDEFDINFY